MFIGLLAIRFFIFLSVFRFVCLSGYLYAHLFVFLRVSLFIWVFFAGLSVCFCRTVLLHLSYMLELSENLSAMIDWLEYNTVLLLLFQLTAVSVTGTVGALAIKVAAKIHSEQDLDFVIIHRHRTEAKLVTVTDYSFQNVPLNLVQVLWRESRKIHRDRRRVILYT